MLRYLALNFFDFFMAVWEAVTRTNLSIEGPLFDMFPLMSPCCLIDPVLEPIRQMKQTPPLI
jgi:hypothetical protein